MDKIVYLSWHFRPYYDGGDILIGVFSSPELAEEAIAGYRKKKIEEYHMVYGNDPYAEDKLPISDFGATSVAVDERVEF